MALLQADPAKTKKLAGDVIDSLARRRLTNGSHVAEYRERLTEIQREFPSLAEAWQSGSIANDDWQTAKMLVPALQNVVESYSQVCKCGQNRALCRARKLADERGVHEDDVRAFSQCIRDAQARGSELDQVMCYFG
jgi:hypothetical protein